MKKYFYILISALAIVLTSTFCFSVWTKHKQTNEKGRCIIETRQARAALDEYYKSEFNHIYRYILRTVRTYTEHSNEVYRDNQGQLKEIKDHMCKDGYNWQQINQMAMRAKFKQQERNGYEDGFNGTEPSEYHKDDVYYRFGFSKGQEQKKTLTRTA